MHIVKPGIFYFFAVIVLPGFIFLCTLFLLLVPGNLLGDRATLIQLYIKPQNS